MVFVDEHEDIPIGATHSNIIAIATLQILDATLNRRYE